jgi:hypothetical protein
VSHNCEMDCVLLTMTPHCCRDAPAAVRGHVFPQRSADGARAGRQGQRRAAEAAAGAQVHHRDAERHALRARLAQRSWSRVTSTPSLCVGVAQPSLSRQARALVCRVQSRHGRGGSDAPHTLAQAQVGELAAPGGHANYAAPAAAAGQGRAPPPADGAAAVCAAAASWLTADSQRARADADARAAGGGCDAASRATRHARRQPTSQHRSRGRVARAAQTRAWNEGS